MDELILHITRRPAWEQARAAGTYAPTSLSTDGFIHFSQTHQVVRVANFAFRGVDDLVLLCVPTRLLSGPLRYETSDRDGEIDPEGERFPHLYGPLNADAVIDVLPLDEGPDGFVLPLTL